MQIRMLAEVNLFYKLTNKLQCCFCPFLKAVLKFLLFQINSSEIHTLLVIFVSLDPIKSFLFMSESQVKKLFIQFSQIIFSQLTSLCRDEHLESSYQFSHHLGCQFYSSSYEQISMKYQDLSKNYEPMGPLIVFNSIQMENNEKSS